MGSFFFRPVSIVSRRGAHGYRTPLFFCRDSTEIWAKIPISGDIRVWFYGDFFCTDRFRKTQRIWANWTCTQDLFLFLFVKNNIFRSEVWPFKVWCAHTPHTTTQHTIPHIIQQHHTPPQGPTRPHRSPHMAGRPPGEKRKRGGFQIRAAGCFDGKPAKNHSLRTLDYNMTTTHVMKETKKTIAAAVATNTAVIVTSAAAARAAREADTGRGLNSLDYRRWPQPCHSG